MSTVEQLEARLYNLLGDLTEQASEDFTLAIEEEEDHVIFSGGLDAMFEIWARDEIPGIITTVAEELAGSDPSDKDLEDLYLARLTNHLYDGPMASEWIARFFPSRDEITPRFKEFPMEGSDAPAIVVWTPIVWGDTCCEGYILDADCPVEEINADGSAVYRDRVDATEWDIEKDEYDISEGVPEDPDGLLYPSDIPARLLVILPFSYDD